MKSNPSGNRVNSLFAEATQHMHWHRYEEAAEVLATLVQSLRDQDDRGALSKVLLKGGICQYELKNFSPAIDLLKEALRLGRDRSDTNTTVECLYELSLALRGAQRQEESDHYIEEAVELALSVGDLPDHMSNHLAILYQEKGEYENARALLEIVKANAQRGHKADTLSVVLNELGIVYFAVGDYSNCIESFSESIKIKLGLDNQRGIQATMNNLFQCLLSFPDSAKGPSVIRQLRNLGISDQQLKALGFSDDTNSP